MKYVYMKAILCFMVFSSCDGVVKTGVIMSSYSINDAKAKKVFSREYRPIPSRLFSQDDSIYIEEVWVENLWLYKDVKKEIKKLNQFNGYVRLTSNIDLFSIKFHYSDKESGVSGKKLTFSLPNYPDTIKTEFVIENGVGLPVLLVKI
ncbi:MAG: hypothetical protein KDC44_22105 [Phaeodactylibacter sp.]|nr:hypothetical protein [Phaeodactylibacter sp.]